MKQNLVKKYLEDKLEKASLKDEILLRNTKDINKSSNEAKSILKQRSPLPLKLLKGTAITALIAAQILSFSSCSSCDTKTKDPNSTIAITQYFPPSEMPKYAGHNEEYEFYPAMLELLNFINQRSIIHNNTQITEIEQIHFLPVFQESPGMVMDIRIKTKSTSVRDSLDFATAQELIIMLTGDFTSVKDFLNAKHIYDTEYMKDDENYDVLKYIYDFFYTKALGYEQQKEKNDNIK